MPENHLDIKWLCDYINQTMIDDDMILDVADWRARQFARLHLGPVLQVEIVRYPCSAVYRARST